MSRETKILPRFVGRGIPPSGISPVTFVTSPKGEDGPGDLLDDLGDAAGDALVGWYVRQQTVNAQHRSFKDTLVDTISIFPPVRGGRVGVTIGTALRALSRGRAAAKAGRGGIGPVRLGQAGEDAVRGAYDIGPKVPIKVGGRGRIPDGLTDARLSEVKNTASLSYTRQIRDLEQYAQQTGRSFDLYVRPTTRLSRPLQREVANGSIDLRFIP